MSALQVATEPPTGLYRIGRLPDPLVWPPWEFTGTGRFDDPQRLFRTLYATEQRRACFAEALAPFRPSLTALARLSEVSESHEPRSAPTIPVEWCRRRCIGRLRLGQGQRWLDLRSLETFEALRAELAHAAVRLGLADIDISAVRGPQREFTRAIARWAYERGFGGIAYKSRLDDRFDCWAIFEGSVFESDGLPEPILPNDADLRAVATLFGLALQWGID